MPIENSLECQDCEGNKYHDPYEWDNMEQAFRCTKCHSYNLKSKETAKEKS